jgi:hypothetical protein
VTEAACEALNELLCGKTATAQRCLRLSTVQGTYRFVLDEPIDQDISFSFQERVVLVVSETISHDLWGITVDCAVEEGKRKLVFRKAKGNEPFDIAKDEADVVPPQWRASQHEHLLEEIADIGRQIASIRGSTKSTHREQLHVLEARKQEKWDAIRTLRAGDGGWHKLNGTTKTPTAAMAPAAAGALNGKPQPIPSSESRLRTDRPSSIRNEATTAPSGRNSAPASRTRTATAAAAKNGKAPATNGARASAASRVVRAPAPPARARSAAKSGRTPVARAASRAASKKASSSTNGRIGAHADSRGRTAGPAPARRAKTQPRSRRVVR